MQAIHTFWLWSEDSPLTKGWEHRDILRDFADALWGVEKWEQYKSREPGISLSVCTETQAKLGFLDTCNEYLEHIYSNEETCKGRLKRKMPQGNSLLTRNGVKLTLNPRQATFEYVDGDRYEGGILIYPVREFVPFAKRR